MKSTGKALGLAFFHDEIFTEFHPRIYDGDQSRVYLNDRRDFAKLHPTPVFDYATYAPRCDKFGTRNDAKQSAYMELRFTTTHSLAPEISRPGARVLEIGANDGNFMKVFRERAPEAHCEGVEPSTPHRESALASGLTMHASTEEIRNDAYDLICMFHTFEHLVDPIAELHRLNPLLRAGGSYVIEIPALTDPLLSMYTLATFKDFYFQAQHPYVYSLPSLRRLLEGAGYEVFAERPIQRYGLGNHLHWLREGKPGELVEFRDASALDAAYRNFLEDRKQTDTIFVRFRPRS